MRPPDDSERDFARKLDSIVDQHFEIRSRIANHCPLPRLFGATLRFVRCVQEEVSQSLSSLQLRTHETARHREVARDSSE